MPRGRRSNGEKLRRPPFPSPAENQFRQCSSTKDLRAGKFGDCRRRHFLASPDERCTARHETRFRFFGCVAPGTSSYTNPIHGHASKNTIFTNDRSTSRWRRVWWEGITRRADRRMHRLAGSSLANRNRPRQDRRGKPADAERAFHRARVTMSPPSPRL